VLRAALLPAGTFPLFYMKPLHPLQDFLLCEDARTPYGPTKGCNRDFLNTRHAERADALSTRSSQGRSPRNDLPLFSPPMGVNRNLRAENWCGQ
jgi:hypothetical protein